MRRRSKQRQQECDAATADRMRGLISKRYYEWADPAQVDDQVRSRTDAPTRSAARAERDALAS